MRKTHALVHVAQVLLDNPHGKHWGYNTSKKSGVKAGVMYPIFKRLLDEGWVTDGWEDSEIPGRPRRRYYQLTEIGIVRLGGLLAEASRDTRFASLNLKPGVAQ